jgi:hypothetical protein
MRLSVVVHLVGVLYAQIDSTANDIMLIDSFR